MAGEIERFVISNSSEDNVQESRAEHKDANGREGKEKENTATKDSESRGERLEKKKRA